MQAGCTKCPKNCHACKILIEGKIFKSTNSAKTYKIKYVVYLVTCQKCFGQYVGKSTQTFARRHSGHKQEIKKRIGGLGQHYGGQQGCGYASLKDLLARREIFCQNQLRCFMENGGHAHCKRKEK